MTANDAAESPMPLSSEFRLSDAEFRRAWLTEYLRRPGFARLRLFLGPAIALFGARALGAAHDGEGRLVGMLAVAFGVWQVARPWLLVSSMLRRRRQLGSAEQPLVVTLDDAGIAVFDGTRDTRLPWKAVTAAGRGRDYVWFEVRGATRATIPLRAVKDEAGLVDALRTRTAWQGPVPAGLPPRA